MTAAERIKIVAEHFEMRPQDVTLDSTLIEIGGDDLDLIELTIAIEEEFDKELNDALLKGVKTIRDFLVMVEPEGASA